MLVGSELEKVQRTSQGSARCVKHADEYNDFESPASYIKEQCVRWILCAF